MTDAIKLQVVLILAVGFVYASVLGYVTQKLKLTPILGYLLAGYLIGPFSPGYIADIKIAEQLAEVGVILMMFGVGLHFKWQDLLNTRKIAVPGAIGQTLVAALLGTWLVWNLGWSLESGMIIGIGIGVASTMVLMRVLSDNNLINTPQGHAAIGWLIVEDIITIVALLLIPSLASFKESGSLHIMDVATVFGLTLFKFALLTIFMFTIGQKLITYVLSRIIQTSSHELFTLSVLAITFAIAASSAMLVGTSIVLGAFVAGMVMGQTRMRHQVATNMMSLKDTFVVIFFLSIGMLFNPFAVTENFLVFLSILGVILIVKPLTAFAITKFLKYSTSTGLTVALGMAQIGEFSFILGEEAMKFDILPDSGYDLLIACSLVSISINPLFFKLLRSYLTPQDQQKSLQ